MKSLIAIIAILSSCFLSAQHVYDVEQKFHEQERTPLSEIASRSDAPSAPFIDVTHVLMRMDAEPNRQTIYGDVTISYTVSKNIDTLWLDFDSNKLMRVTTVQDDFTLNTKSYRENNFLVIPLSRTHVTGVKHRIRIVYNGTPDGADIRSYFQSDNKHVWTRSEPYGARYWWPCIMTLQDKIDSADIYLLHPKQFTGVSNGLLQRVDSSRSKAVTHWKHTYPMAFYLLAFSIGDYNHISQDIIWPYDTVRVENYIFDDQLPWVSYMSGHLRETFQLFDSLFGEYPFKREHYGHVQTSIGGGMEHQTMSHMYDLNQPLVAHELAHQWFGNKITCGSWEDLWLNESFATYLTALTYEKGFGDRDWMQWKINTNNWVTSNNNGSVFPVDTNNFNILFSSRLTYNKGALVLNTLRHQIGDQAFFSGIRNFITDPKLSYDFAVTEQLQSHLESASGRDLKEFFDDWYRGEGHPNYLLKYNMINSNIIFDVEQMKSTNASPLFDMDLNVAVYLNGNRFDFYLPITQANETFVRKFGRIPDSVKIDPDYNALIGGRDVREGTHVVGIDAKIAEHTIGFTVFPSPSSSIIQVRVSGIVEEDLRYTITNSNGTLVLNGIMNSEEGEVDLEQLNSGVYFIELSSDNKTARQRIIKH